VREEREGWVSTTKVAGAHRKPPHTHKHHPSPQHMSGCPIPTTTHKHAKYTHKCMGGRTGTSHHCAMRGLEDTAWKAGGLGLANRQPACLRLREALRATQGCAPSPCRHNAINTVQLHTVMLRGGPQSPGKDTERGPDRGRPALVSFGFPRLPGRNVQRFPSPPSGYFP
jgi:hypothetical protein